MLTQEQRAFYGEQGYLIVQQLFSADEVDFYRAHYMQLRSQGSYPGDLAGVDVTSSDPLKKYPRMIHMHRWDEVSLKWLIDPRINACLTALAGREPYAVQTMLYFKPPGARGQALHQDQYYLRAKPGTCIAAWMALDDCDEENGCLQLVPGSQHWPLLCTIAADTTQSFTDITVPLPEGTPVVPAIMRAGDVLFFNGQIVHGSPPNRTANRFRRALIGHYIEGHAETVARFYHPVLKMDGTPLEIGQSPDGSECGVWVERDGRKTIELAAVQSGPGKTE